MQLEPGAGAAGTDGVSHEDVFGFRRLETELCIILRACQCLKRPQLLIRKRVFKQEVAWVCISRLPELLSVDAPVRERVHVHVHVARLWLLLMGSSPSSHWLTHFLPSDTPTLPSSLQRVGGAARKRARRARRRAFRLLKKTAAWKSILAVLFLFSRTPKFFPRVNHLKLLKS